MGSIAEQVFETVKVLTDSQAAEVLDFAEFLKTKAKQSHAENSVSSDNEFFSYAGIWQDRDINQETLRKGAWREDRP